MSTRHDPVDVVVVGAGPGGAIASLVLARKGLKVVCLEQGDWVDRADYPGDKPEWELLAAKPWSSASVLRDAPSDYPIDLSASEYGVLNWNGVGGGSILYNAQWPRMLPDDFRVRSVDGVAADWPLGRKMLPASTARTDQPVCAASAASHAAMASAKASESSSRARPMPCHWLP